MYTAAQNGVLINIQTLRALAAINVVILHSIYSARDYNFTSAFCEFFGDWGANGVDLFFVISGFIMVYVQNARARDPLTFFKQRLKRIVPLYWFHLSILSGLMLIFPSVFRSVNFDWLNIVASYGMVSTFVLEAKPIVSIGWTLEYEMLFYILFSLAIFFRKPIYSYAFITIMLLSLVLFAGVNPIVMEFIFGLIVGFITVNKEKYFKNITNYHWAFILFLGVSLLASSLFFHYEIHRVVKWGVPSFLIVLAAVFLKQLNNSVLLFLGNASYSIYLFHWFVTPAFFKSMAIANVNINTNLLVFLCVFLSSFSGLLVHLIVEKNLDRLLKLKMKKS